MKDIKILKDKGVMKGPNLLTGRFLERIKSTAKITLTAIMACSLYGCADMLDVEPVTDLDKDRYYQNEFDADVAVIGIYGQVMRLAEQYVVLNELRADLMEPTMNANADLVALSNHTVRAQDNNRYTNPKPFYTVILNCNDALEGFEKMRNENRIGINEYNQRISDIIAIRTWVYLQLGIHFGEVPFITTAINSINDVKNPALFTRLRLDALLDQLIIHMEEVPYIDVYPNNIALMAGTDGYATNRFFINKRVLLGDLYLWKGNFESAAVNYREVMETATTVGGGAGRAYYDTYRVSWASAGDHGVQYTKEDDLSSLVNTNDRGFRSIFARPIDAPYNYEWVWAMHFNSEFAPNYPFIRMFANEGVGQYLLKPSTKIMEKWNNQTQVNNFEFDARGLLSTKNYHSSQPEIGKYTFNYNFLNSPLVQNGRWFLERAASLHLKYAEATNRGSHPELSRLAQAFINNGLRDTYMTPGLNRSVDDVTDAMNTLHLPYPYDFDAREGQFPYFRGPWYRHTGLRSRANLTAIPMPEDLEGEAQKLWVEELIINETALELAFEGHRWPQLLRIAMRRDPSVLADRVYEKLSNSTSPTDRARASEARAKLMNGDWFLPFNWEE